MKNIYALAQRTIVLAATFGPTIWTLGKLWCRDCT